MPPRSTLLTLRRKHNKRSSPFGIPSQSFSPAVARETTFSNCYNTLWLSLLQRFFFPGPQEVFLPRTSGGFPSQDLRRFFFPGSQCFIQGWYGKKKLDFSKDKLLIKPVIFQKNYIHNLCTKFGVNSWNTLWKNEVPTKLPRKKLFSEKCNQNISFI